MSQHWIQPRTRLSLSPREVQQSQGSITDTYRQPAKHIPRLLLQIASFPSSQQAQLKPRDLQIEVPNRRLSDIFSDTGHGDDGFFLDNLDLQHFKVHKSSLRGMLGGSQVASAQQRPLQEEPQVPIFRVFNVTTLWGFQKN